MVRSSLKYQIRSQRRVSKVRQGIRLENKAQAVRKERQEKEIKQGIKGKKKVKVVTTKTKKKESEWKVAGLKKQKKKKPEKIDVTAANAQLPPRPERSEELKRFLAMDDPAANRAPTEILPSWGHFDD